jgi:hypothetical protein
LLFQTNGLGRFYRSGESWVVTINTDYDRKDPYLVAVLDKDLRTGHIYDSQQIPESGLFPFPLTHPLGQVFMADLLASNFGVIFHACGMINEGVGSIFVGRSGDGKSTLARYFLDIGGIKLLNDDRIILRNHKGNFQIYGSPWHGEVTTISPLDAPLQKIYILNQASHNQVVQLDPLDAAKQLFVRCFPTFWNKDGMKSTLTLIDKIVRNIPCYQLDFLPGPEIVEMVQ